MTTNKDYTLKHNNKDYIFKRKVMETETNIEVNSSYNLTISTVDYPKYNKYEVGIIEKEFYLPVSFNSSMDSTGLSNIFASNTNEMAWLDEYTLAIRNKSVISRNFSPSPSYGYDRYFSRASFAIIFKDDTIKFYCGSATPYNIYRNDVYDDRCIIDADTSSTLTTFTIRSNGYAFDNNEKVLSIATRLIDFHCSSLGSSSNPQPEVYFIIKDSVLEEERNITPRYSLRIDLFPDEIRELGVGVGSNIKTDNIYTMLQEIPISIILNTTQVYRGLQKSYTLKRKVN